MKILIKNGRVINPATNLDKITDILIVNEKVSIIQENITEFADTIIDATGKIVSPGFIDLHTHMRDPGQTHKEDVATGSKSGAAGGFTTICAMPNTKPVTDNKEVVKLIIDKCKKEAIINILPVGAITLAQNGEVLADFKEMKTSGICAISEDGKSVLNEDIMEKAMIASKAENLAVLAHCEDMNLVKGGVMNKGETSEKLGLPGISNEVEDVITDRDINIAKKTGAKLHICHISTEKSVELVRNGKKNGVNVSAEVCPHHFILSDEDINGLDANYKMNPPLRSKKDVQAMLNGIKDGTIEVIATDHAPHQEDEKSKGFLHGPNGIVGLETAFSLSYTYLVKKEHITEYELIKKMTINPAQVIGIDKGDIQQGKIADITIFDINEKYNIDKNKFFSKSKNTPFDKMEVYGKILTTIVDGKIVYNVNN